MGKPIRFIPYEGPRAHAYRLNDLARRVCENQDEMKELQQAPVVQGGTVEHVQSGASAEWIFNHNLGGKPSGVAILNPGGAVVDAEVLHTSDNQLRVYFSSPQAGRVRASL